MLTQQLQNQLSESQKRVLELEAALQFLQNGLPDAAEGLERKNSGGRALDTPTGKSAHEEELRERCTVLEAELSEAQKHATSLQNQLEAGDSKSGADVAEALKTEILALKRDYEAALSRLESTQKSLEEAEASAAESCSEQERTEKLLEASKSQLDAQQQQIQVAVDLCNQSFDM